MKSRMHPQLQPSGAESIQKRQTRSRNRNASAAAITADPLHTVGVNLATNLGLMAARIVFFASATDVQVFDEGTVAIAKHVHS